jgi:hypothetical protein
MSEHGEGYHASERHKRQEDALLVAKGFEPVEKNLWSREGVRFGRGAAPQELWRTDALRQRRGSS